MYQKFNRLTHTMTYEACSHKILMDDLMSGVKKKIGEKITITD